MNKKSKCKLRIVCYSIFGIGLLIVATLQLALKSYYIMAVDVILAIWSFYLGFRRARTFDKL